MQFPEIEHCVPFADYPPSFETFQERVAAAFASVAALVQEESMLGVDVPDEDIIAARQAFIMPPARNSKQLSSPGAVVHIKALLDAYDEITVASTDQLRTYITNRLLEDSSNPDPRVRLKCYELLGKISDVGLFTDKTEVTLRHRPTEELEQLLRERLVRTLEGVAVEVPYETPEATQATTDLAMP
jgi:hypothetical protein